MSPTPTPATTSDDIARETKPLAVTTQFSPPKASDCGIRDFIEASPGDDLFKDWRESPYSWYIYSDPQDPRFTNCQPSGWADRPSSQRFSFSPAVCPSHWIWSNIRVEGKFDLHEHTTAQCCSEGFYFSARNDNGTKTYAGRCFSDFGSGPSTTINATFLHGEGDVSSITSGVMVHEAWHITWRASDQEILDPVPPTLTGKTYGLETWDGKQDSIQDDDYLDSGSSSQNELKGLETIYVLVICLTILFAMLIGMCCSWCVHQNKKDREEERQRRLAAAAASAITAPASAPASAPAT
ncbi:hypothetical protein CC79DRAFT_808557 [Sarocladium strictum]